MNDGDGQRGWRWAVQSRLARLQQQDGRLREMALLWLAVVASALLVCVVFFLVVYWIFG